MIEAMPRIRTRAWTTTGTQTPERSRNHRLVSSAGLYT
jgi:hypothetical protein